MECGMSPDHRRSARDLALRAAGLLFLVVAFMALRHMIALVHLRSPHEASLGEMAFAAAGFLGLSAGSTLATLGAHIFDEVEISERWMRLPGHPFTQLPAADDEPNVARNDNPARAADFPSVRRPVPRQPVLTR
jgi:hypothetical protein